MLGNFSPPHIPSKDDKPISHTQALQLLYRVLANHRQFSSFCEGINAILSTGRQHFSSKVAFVLRPISGDVLEVLAWSGKEAFFVGQHVTIPELTVLDGNKEKSVFTVNNLAQITSQANSKAYNLDDVRICFGTDLELYGSERGLLCFFDSDARSSGFSQENVLLLELMAEGIACMTELQKARAQRKTDDLALFAYGSVKTLEEYKDIAHLPEGLGICGKVVDVLNKRIGHSSLSIDNIAEELNLSKRTLQRRLQQQGISFAELRDKVRFSHAIDYLVKQQTSIDRISSTLDFSDRTSFTNAFKRWTGLSPSTFRKVFRDYA